MMQLKNYLMILCCILLLANCTQPEPEVQIQTEYVEKTIPTVPRPAPINLVVPKFYVVTSENFEEFIDEFSSKNGTQTFIALSVKDYENLSISIAELKRYLEQQDQIIIYYEEQVS